MRTPPAALVYSRVYHKTLTRLKAQGADAEAAKEEARSKAQAARVEFGETGIDNFF